jgi:1-acyl-sn-glycerol-3-phosphate acyltransferase
MNSNVLPLPPRAPRANTPAWLRRLAEWLLRLSGWKMAGQWPDLDKMVVVGAPHSSAWDGIYGLIAKVAMDLHIVFMGKQEVFFWPLGPLLKWLGGIPVNRASPGGIAEQVAEQLIHAERMWFVLAPEGTRKAVAQWKPGFWKIAKKANLPVVCVYFDYPSKTIGVGKVFELSDDMESDIAAIRAWYAPYQGKHRGV